MMHPLYMEAMKMSEQEKKQDIDLKLQLQPELKKELNLILDDNYARGPFIGMIFNKYIDCILAEQPMGADHLIQQVLLIRLEAKKMAKVDSDKSEDLEPDKPKVKLVM